MDKKKLCQQQANNTRKTITIIEKGKLSILIAKLPREKISKGRNSDRVESGQRWTGL